jgi:hypothetical protein
MKYELIFLNSITGDILKGDLLKAENRRSSDGVKAAIALKKDEARILAQIAKRAEARALGIAPTPTEEKSVEKSEEKSEEKAPVAETKAPEVITLEVPAVEEETPF